MPLLGERQGNAAHHVDRLGLVAKGLAEEGQRHGDLVPIDQQPMPILARRPVPVRHVRDVHRDHGVAQPTEPEGDGRLHPVRVPRELPGGDERPARARRLERDPRAHGWR